MRVALLLFAGLLVGQQPSTQATLPRASASFHGRLVAGENYQHRFGPDFTFVMTSHAERRDGVTVPTAAGWELSVLQDGRDDDIASFTPLFGGVREYWVVADLVVPGADTPGRLIFSPEVGRSTTEDLIQTALSYGNRDDIDALLARIEAFGSLDFTITDMKMDGSTRQGAAFEWVAFDVTATWPANYTPIQP